MGIKYWRYLLLIPAAGLGWLAGGNPQLEERGAAQESLISEPTAAKPDFHARLEVAPDLRPVDH
jgi:hypothetical protein